MNELIPFIFNDQPYYSGTIVQVNEEWQQNFRFHSTLKFIGCSVSEDIYCFTTLQDNWTVYTLSNEQIPIYIKKILKEVTIESDNDDIEPQYIEGIVSAWMWYLIIMFFAFFAYGVANKVCVWVVATFIFFSWRHKKIKGG